MKPINWLHIFANGGLSFFTVLTALHVNGIESLASALTAATLTAGIAILTEVKKESKGGIKKVTAALAASLPIVRPS